MWIISTETNLNSATTSKLVYYTNMQVFDNYAVTVMIGGEPYTLGLFDTASECMS